MHKVELEFKRIQTYLFISPRLRAMLGANSILGSTIRICLPKIARECGALADQDLAGKMPKVDTRDPLQGVAKTEPDVALLIDNPAGVYQDYGVLVRDGGHFIATFSELDKAHEFIRRASEHITKALPGLLLEARLDGEKLDGKKDERSLGSCMFQHPSFQVSRYLGNRPAESQDMDSNFVSAEEREMETHGKTFRNQSRDLIALLEKSQLIPCPDESPQGLVDLVDGGYLALIHADGNSIGQRYQEWQRRMPSAKGLDKEAHGERFFYSMRVAVRCALIKALKRVFDKAPKNYQLLMLGGDDLWLACAAPYALCFIHAYADELKGIDLCDGKPLTIGAGIAIAKETFPFHRLHSMAEALADSAKQRFRGNPALGSVVDWHITTSAWVNDPLAERQSESLAADAVLSSKPYPIFGSSSLSTLLDGMEKIRQSPDIARSQLRNLVEIMRQGSNLAELAWLELPDKARNSLSSILADFDQQNQSQKLDKRLRVLPDLVELTEIDRQGRSA